MSVPAGVTYNVTRMRDEIGSFVRLTASSNAAWFVVTQTEPIRTLDNVPVTIRGQIRSSSSAKQALQVFDFYEKEKFTQLNAEGAGGKDWNTLSLHLIVKKPDERDYYSLGLFDVKKGDSFDIRELSAYIGYLP